MKVKELIEKLEKLDPNLDVFIYDTEGNGPAWINNISVQDCPDDYPEEYNMPDKWVEIVG